MAAEAVKMRNLKDIHEDDGVDGEQAGADAQPLDALAMQRVLASMGADKFEPRVVSQLQEFVHRASVHPSVRSSVGSAWLLLARQERSGARS